MNSDELIKMQNEQYIRNKMAEIESARAREREGTLAAPTQLDRVEEQLNALTADSMTVEKLNAAISEGVNEV